MNRSRITLRLVIPVLGIAFLFSSVARAAESVRVSLDLKNASLPAALHQLEAASGLRLAFSDDLVKSAEPVTLSAKDEPADDVLRAILRPRGMEAVYSTATLAAVVPATSEAGMAKMIGRALRTFVRLDRKLEAAVCEGDEVKVPEWNDADDRALAEGIIDMAAAGTYLEPENAPQPTELARLLGIYDIDVRVGAFLPALLRDSRPEGFEAAGNKAWADPDPVIRASGLGMLACACSVRDASARKMLLETAAKDKASEVRVTAALLTAFINRDSQPAIIGPLRGDSSPAVRAVAWAMWLDRNDPGANDPAMLELGQALLAEKNPILKPLGLVFACMFNQRAAGSVQQLLNAPEVAEDPWLRFSAELIASILAASRATPVQDNGTAATAGPAAAPVDERATALNRLAELMASDKPSHRVFAVGSMMLTMTWAANGGDLRPDFSKVAALADSACPWVRFAAVTACGFCPGDAFEERILKALKSKDELDRIAALFALAGNAPGPAEAKSKNAAAVNAAVITILESPRYFENMLATRALAGRIPFEEMIAIFQDEARRNPHGAKARWLLRAFRLMTAPNEEVRSQRLMMVLDAVLESKDPELQVHYARTTMYQFRSSKPLLLTMIVEMEPEALSIILNERAMAFEVQHQEFAARALLERLKSIFDKGGSQALVAMKGLAGCLDYAVDFYQNEELKQATLELVDTMLVSCTAPNASEEKLAAALDLLGTIFGDRGLVTYHWWKGSTPGMRAAITRLLPCVEHKTFGPKVLSLLAACYRRINLGEAGKDDPAFVAAMEAARRKILAGDHPADQVALLTGIAMSADEATAAPGIDELSKRFVAGTVPADQRASAMRAISRHAGRLSAEFVQFLLRGAADPAEPIEFRHAASTALMQCRTQYAALVESLGKMATSDDAAFATTARFLYPGIRGELARLKKDGQPVPDWAIKAADIGLSIATDTARNVKLRASGIHLYACAAGAKAAGMLEAFIHDDKLDPDLRAAAAAMIADADPETKLFAAMAEKYDSLPDRLRTGLGIAATRARKAEGAEAFLIRTLKDDKIRRLNDGTGRSWDYRLMALRSIDLPATPTLIAALRELENDPEIGAQAKDAVRRLQAQEKKQ